MGNNIAYLFNKEAIILSKKLNKNIFKNQRLNANKGLGKKKIILYKLFRLVSNN